jgi:hypothetical protein
MVVKVWLGRTAARFRLLDPTAVRRWLLALITTRLHAQSTLRGAGER